MNLTPAEKILLSTIGKRGGNATLKKKGKKHFKAMAKKRWSLTKKQSTGKTIQPLA